LITLDSYSIALKGEEGEIEETRLKTGNTGREHPSTISLALTFMPLPDPLYLSTTTIKMSTINRCKPYQYKQNRVAKLPVTSRKEMNPVTRAFVVSAIVASRDGYASAAALLTLMLPTQQGLSALVRRVEQRAKDDSFNL
jgi:hypothetical protein